GRTDGRACPPPCDSAVPRRCRRRARRDPLDHPCASRLLGAEVTDTDQRGAIGFAEKVLELLDEGRYTATYKYAVLLALIDVCLEHTKASGAPPDMVTTRQIAAKTVEMYWPHTLPFAARARSEVLRQNI